MNVKSEIESNFRVPVFGKLALGVFVFFMFFFQLSYLKTAANLNKDLPTHILFELISFHLSFRR